MKPLVDLTEMALKAHFPKGAVIRLKGLLSEVPDGLTSESDCLHLADRILTMIQQACEQPTQSNLSTPSAATDNSSSDDAETDQADNSPDSDDDCHSEQDENSNQVSQEDDDPVHHPSSNHSGDDGETGKPDHSQILAALLTAGGWRF